MSPVFICMAAPKANPLPSPKLLESSSSNCTPNMAATSAGGAGLSGILSPIIKYVVACTLKLPKPNCRPNLSVGLPACKYQLSSSICNTDQPALPLAPVPLKKPPGVFTKISMVL